MTDDIRCPMCGKPNPAELDTCQFCEARLKPLIAGGASGAVSETPDWLSGLRDEEGNAFDFADSAAGAQDDSMDWLARLGDAVGGDQPAQESSDQPDWMRGFEETQSTSDDEPTLAFETPDLNAAGFFADQPEGGAGETGQVPEFSAQDWFTESTEPAGAESAAQDAAQDLFSEQAEEGLPDWFTQSSDAGESPAAAAFDARSLFSEEETSDSFAAPEAEQPASEETAFFDWQTGGQEPAAQESATASPFEEPKPAGGLPDWLNWDSAEASEAPPASEPAPTGETSDWLSAFSDSQADAGSAAFDMPLEGAEDSSAEPAGGPQVVSPFSFLEDDEEATTPFGLESDWSTGGLGEAAAPAAPASDEPDWLTSLIAPESGFPASQFEAESEAAAVPEGQEAEPSAFSDWGGADEQPAWLQGGVDLGSAQPPSAPAFSFDQTAESEESAALPLDAAPDWISQVSVEDAAPLAEFPAGEEEPADAKDLAPANLPGWLEAMRPVDAIALEDFKDSSDERMETAGPLAGLRGALPASLETSAVAAAPAASFKVNISEETSARLNLLNEMIAAESQPRKAAAGAELMTGAVIRLVLFVALMLAAIWALWYGEQPGTTYLQTAPLSPAAMEFQQRLNLLSGQPVVLVAVEVETAFSGEMDAAAESLLTFLAARRAQIVFVSTNTAGPFLAERYMQRLNEQTARGGEAYANYANLGYLPGGPAGLVAFLNAPEKALTLTLSGQPAWDAAAAAGSAGLGRFDAVVVLTASSENARLWIEQAGPLLRSGAVPLLFSVSAQAAPLLQPYFDASPRMVAGILAGLPAVYQFNHANALEQLSGQPARARQLIDAYSAVVLAAVLILLIGIVANLVSHLLSARTKERTA